jgi:hypothetical protein
MPAQIFDKPLKDLSREERLNYRRQKHYKGLHTTISDEDKKRMDFVVNGLPCGCGAKPKWVTTGWVCPKCGKRINDMEKTA